MPDFPYGKDYPEEPWIDRDGQPINGHQDEQATDELTTWEAVDLGPWIRGEQQQPTPSVGLARSDGQRLIYAGREHAVVGETESGKSWLALGCVAAELAAGHPVLYIHYEESHPGSTVERLGMLGISPDLMMERLRFVAPSRPVRAGWLEALLTPAPTLVVHDGINEGMSLHGADIMAADGASTFRRRLIVPCLRAGAATLACDHVPKSAEGRGRDAYGSVHKGNALDGARIVLENTKPFGQGLRGVSHVFITKDRPGQLRAHGQASKLAGKTFFGTLVVDDGPLSGPDVLQFHAPKENTGSDVDPAAELADTIHDTIAALPEGTVESLRMLLAELRKAGHQFRDTGVRNALDDLIVAGRVAETTGRRGARGYRVISPPAELETPEEDRKHTSDLPGATASQPSTDSTASPTASASASPIGGEAGSSRGVTASEAVGSSGKQSTERLKVPPPQLSGDAATIVFHSSISGVRREPVRKFSIGQSRPYAQHPVSVSVDYVKPRKRRGEGVVITPGRTLFITVECNGETVYDSRSDVPCDMDEWNAVRARFSGGSDE